MIRAHLATYPPRYAMLMQALPSICGQVDAMFLVLNEYDAVPEGLTQFPNLHAILPDTDLKDVGKFLPEPAPDDVVVFVDDDLIYAPDFVSHLVSVASDLGIKDHVVGLHGSTYTDLATKGGRARSVIPFHRPRGGNVAVDQLATNSMLALGRNVAPLSVMHGSQKFVDVRYAGWLFEQGITLVCAGRRQHLALPIEDEDSASETIYDTFTRKNHAHVLREICAFAGRNPRVAVPLAAAPKAAPVSRAKVKGQP